jgi:hypothetical protein
LQGFLVSLIWSDLQEMHQSNSPRGMSVPSLWGLRHSVRARHVTAACQVQLVSNTQHLSTCGRRHCRHKTQTMSLSSQLVDHDTLRQPGNGDAPSWWSVMLPRKVHSCTWCERCDTIAFSGASACLKRDKATLSAFLYKALTFSALPRAGECVLPGKGSTEAWPAQACFRSSVNNKVDDEKG